MGRGRQKAKHTKVARDLKYYSPPTDLSALERELASSRSADDGGDEWEDLAARWNTDDEDWDEGDDSSR